MAGAETSIVVEAPSKILYDVVADFEKYPEFLPDVKDVSIQKKGKNPVVNFEISVIKKVNYTLAMTLAPKKISWKFVEGDLFKDNKGYWEFEEMGKGKTKATYHIEVDFGFMVPSLITNKLVGSNLPTMMKRFKERAEELA